jgi:hypothetical protein
MLWRRLLRLSRPRCPRIRVDIAVSVTPVNHDVSANPAHVLRAYARRHDPSRGFARDCASRFAAIIVELI